MEIKMKSLRIFLEGQRLQRKLYEKEEKELKKKLQEVQFKIRKSSQVKIPNTDLTLVTEEGEEYFTIVDGAGEVIGIPSLQFRAFAKFLSSILETYDA